MKVGEQCLSKFGLFAYSLDEFRSPIRWPNPGLSIVTGPRRLASVQKMTERGGPDAG
jgi:hypothetical protein